jgi:hypothetical protein
LGEDRRFEIGAPAESVPACTCGSVRILERKSAARHVLSVSRDEQAGTARAVGTETVEAMKHAPEATRQMTDNTI